jgi:hypothetical protein
MPVHDLECPNCGATVEFGSGMRATCAYCHSALLLAGNTVQNETAPPSRAATPPTSLPRAVSVPFKVARPMNPGKWLRTGCALVLLSQFLFVCVCGSFVALASNLIMKTWGPLDQVAAIVQEQPQVAQALGQPVKLGALTSSSIQSKNGVTTAKFDAPVIGAQASGKVHVEGRWLEDGWDLDVWITYAVDGVERQIVVERRGVR